ncbi:PspC domain-containing protein [Endozoicomonadaceae bacterium StTr2]
MKRILKEIFTQQEDSQASPAIMGVCSYIANRFHLDVLAVRIATVGGAYFFTSTSRAILAYITIGVLLSMSGSSTRGSRKKRKKAREAAHSGETTGAARPQAADMSEPADSYPKLTRPAVKQMARRLKRLEKRVSGLEGCITSGHLKMARDFRDLDKKRQENSESDTTATA